MSLPNRPFDGAQDRAPDPIREGVARAVHAFVEQGGAVLFGRDGQPFAFYPAQARDPGAPARLREIVERRLEECRAEAVRAAKAGLAGGGEG
jgi:hypothetical protein